MEVNLRFSSVLLSCSILASGCAPTDGVWAIFISAAGPIECETSVDHNFLGAMQPPEAPTNNEWVVEQTFEGSPAVLFARVFDVAGEDSKILVVGDQAYFGNRSGGVWDFTWTGNETTEDSEAHQSGYTFFDHTEANQVTKLSLDLSGQTGTGTLTQTGTSTTIWEESDAWESSDVGFFSGQIPAGNYLVDSTGYPVSNDSDGTDCSGTPCTLTVESDCTQSSPFEARRTDAGDEDFSGLEDAGQEFGTGDT